VAWTVAEAAERIEAAEAGKGVEAARRAVRLDPGNFDAQLALARGLIHLGDVAAALPAASRASDLRPGDATAREALADALWLSAREPAAFSPRATATPAIVSSTPAVRRALSRSWPSAAAITIVRSGNVAKISAARADGMKRSP